MEREVSSVTHLSVMLVSVALVLSIAWFTVSMGNGIKAQAYNGASDLTSQMATSQLNSINDRDPIMMPKAAAYSLVSQEYNGVEKIVYVDRSGNQSTVEFTDRTWESTGYITGNYVSPQDILESSLTGKVLVEATRSASGTYVVTITDVD